MAAHTLEASVEAVCQRKVEAMTAIRSSTWEELGLTEPSSSLEEWSEVTGIDLAEMRKVAPSLLSDGELAELKAREEETEAKEADEKRERDEAEKKLADSAAATVRAAKDSAPSDVWVCQHCTVYNPLANDNCEVCALPKSAENAGETEKPAATPGATEESKGAAAPEEEKKEEE
jgi:hypothetical protein